MYADSLFMMNLGAEPLGGDEISNTATFRLDATANKAAIIIRAEKDMTVNQVGLLFSGLTGSPTYLVSLQGVTAAGVADGTILGGGSPVSMQFDPSGNGLQWLTFDNAHSISRNDDVAIVIEDHASGTDPDGVNYIDIVRADLRVAHHAPPYCSVDTGGGWSDLNQVLGIYGLRNSGTTTDVQGFPVETPGVAADNLVTTSGDRLAQKFILPENMGHQVQVSGLIMLIFATQDFKLGIWDASGQIVATGDIDHDHAYNSGANYSTQLARFAPTWLDTGTEYYAGAEQSGAGLIIVGAHDMVTDDNLSAFPGYPNNNMVKFTSSSWSDLTGYLCSSMGILVDAFDPSHTMKINAGLVQ